jgi:TonB family protein
MLNKIQHSKFNIQNYNLCLAIILTAVYIILNIIFFSKTEEIFQNTEGEIAPANDMSINASGIQSTTINNTGQLRTSNLNPKIITNQILTETFIEKPSHINSNNLPILLNNNIPDQTDEVFTVVEEYPSFPGGDKARIKFLQENIHYPSEALHQHLEGKVIINFNVEKDGTVSNIKVIDGVKGGCNEEALRVAKLMPKWKPGMQSGRPVRVNFNMPITFKLNLKDSSNTL